MNFDRFLPFKLKEFFQNYPVIDSLQLVNLLVFRRDGVILYTNSDVIDKDMAGALMGGVWQAVDALIALIPSSKDSDLYRLSFDTSSKGIYMLPFSVCEQEYYLSIIYSNQDNPAIIKNKLRELGVLLGQEMTDFFSSQEMQSEFSLQKPNMRMNEDKFLFKDISDAEMDQIFSHVSG